MADSIFKNVIPVDEPTNVVQWIEWQRLELFINRV